MRVGGALLAVIALAGCASVWPAAELEPPPDDVDVSAAAETLGVLLGEVTAFATGAEGPAGIVPDGATVDVATAELAAALPLGDDAVAFAAATAFEMTRAGDDVPAPAEVTSVASEARVVEMVGELDGHPVATVRVVLDVAAERGPVREEEQVCTVVVDGETLLAVHVLPGSVDRGEGVRSPTGAALRFVELVRVGDLDAATYFSDGVNTSTTELEVLARAVTDVDVQMVEVPQALAGDPDGDTHVVYALDADARVLGRFEVTIGNPGDRTTVVYTPTS